MAQHAISEFCFFFSRPAFFLCNFFLFVFIEVLATKRVASLEDSLGFLSLCDLLVTFIENCFEKKFDHFFPQVFVFFARFSVEQNRSPGF